MQNYTVYNTATMGPKEIWKLYVPDLCLACEQQGYLLGYTDHAARIAVVSGFIPHHFPDNVTHDAGYNQKINCHIIGHISNSNHGAQSAEFDISSRTTWFSIEQSDCDLPQCTVSVKCDNILPELMVIIYNADSLFQSSLLVEQSSSTRHCAGQDVVKCLKQAKQHMISIQSSGPLADNVVNYLQTDKERYGYGVRLPVCVKDLLASKVIDPVKTFSSQVGNSSLLNNAVLRKVLEVPCLWCQLRHKWTQVNTLLHPTTTATLRYHNEIIKLLLDTFLGVCVLLLVCSTDVTTHWATELMNWAESVAVSLQQLLEWMMGVPAGLKLNSQLDQLLGKFFLYHIYLWKGYLQFIQPVLGPALWYSSLAGVLGVTVQLSLAQDILAIMTLHIYCFYVYAARLYSLQVYILASLWRLFRGKKWNVLRQRVDSASYDVDQLFLGTLLFTILLFLLPTTALYYVVFTLLRLLVLTIQGTVHHLVKMLNGLPVYIMLLRLFNPSSLADQLDISVLPRVHGRPLYLSMQVKPSNYGSLLASFWTHPHHTDATDSWPSLCHKLITGHLIYPWIEKKH